MKDMSMQIKYMCVQTMYIKEVLDIDNMIFKPLEDLKKVKYKKIEIFKDGQLIHKYNGTIDESGVVRNLSVNPTVVNETTNRFVTFTLF